MNSNVVIAIVVAAVVVCAGVGAVLILGNMNSDESGVTEGVNYHGNGGKTSEGKTVMGSTTHDVIPNIFKYDGYKFVSWNTKADGSGTTYKAGDYIEFGSGKSVDLYAIWHVDGSMLYVSTLIGSLSFYYGGVHVGFGGVDIPDSGPIDVTVNVPSGATDVTIEKTDKGIHRITYKMGTTTYLESLYVSVGGEDTDFEWVLKDDVITLTIEYNKCNVSISYNQGTIG